MSEEEIIAVLKCVKLPEDGLALNDATSALKKFLLGSALIHAKGNKAYTARLLKLKAETIIFRMRKLDLMEMFPSIPRGGGSHANK